MNDKPTNALAHERSPYLLQHAHNPVDWLPWGDAAIEKAQREEKPIFLSVGYSACHWCHVMERESFEDEGTALVLNELFVPVKVDREERPDIDQAFQLAHQLITQRSGGWPLSMFLTPDTTPFYGGTYFPGRPRFGRPSFREVLTSVAEAWDNRREELMQQGERIAHEVARVATLSPKTIQPSKSLFDEAITRVLPRIDTRMGGFGSAPKFPNTMALDLLAIASVRQPEERSEKAWFALRTTLTKMRDGGLWDHLAGGFARYSTDEEWKVPHFEKMLYDNGLLMRSYSDGARLARARGEGDIAVRFESVVTDTAEYLLREMRSPEGCFYSSQDADSDGEEGRFATWTVDELEAVLDRDTAAAIAAWYDVTIDGNWEHSRSVLWTPRPLDEVARELGQSEDSLRELVEKSRPVLLAARKKRPQPLCDDKCLASWNALVIGSLADAGATFGRDDLVSAARRALFAWRERAWRSGQLLHAMKSGEAYGDGYCDDHAAMARAAVDVWEATFDPEALAFARDLADALIAHFYDPETHEFFFVSSTAPVVLHRSRDPFDHAHPGSAGLSIEALSRLAAITGHEPYRDTADRAAARYASAATGNPMGLASVVRAVDRVATGDTNIVITGALDDPRVSALFAAARGLFLPHRTLVATAAAGIDPELSLGRASAPDGSPRAFVCRGTECELPVSTPEALSKTLRAKP